MSKSTLEADLIEEFEVFSIVLEPIAIEKFGNLCIKYSISAKAIAETWIAYSVSNGLSWLPSPPVIDEFEKMKLKILSMKPKIKKRATTESSFDEEDASIADAINGEADELLDMYASPEMLKAIRKRREASDIPSSKRPPLINSFVSPTAKPSISLKIHRTPSAKYSSRINSGEVLSEFGNCKNGIWGRGASDNQDMVEYNEIMVISQRYRYMQEKMRTVAKCLNSEIECEEDGYQEKYAISEFSHVAMPAVGVVDVIGRICCDGKLTSKSILLEGSYRTSAGTMTELDVSNLDSYSLFPGQIVALSGINPSGKTFLAQKIYDPGTPSPAPSVSLSGPLTIYVVAGPYTTSDSLSYDPLEDFLQIVKNSNPHVCILIGPFLDDKNSDIVEKKALPVFAKIFADYMNQIAKCAKDMPTTEFVIVSSTRDANHHPIYPSVPFKPDFKYRRFSNMRFVSDPSIISLNGLQIAVTATDVLFHLGKEELSSPPGQPDRLGRLASHLLVQRSFYPLYPPPETVPMNLEKRNEFLKLASTPHIFILPSDFNCFIKNISGCCFINPQRLTRGLSAGSYACLNVSPVQNTANPLSNFEIACQVMRI